MSHLKRLALTALTCVALLAPVRALATPASLDRPTATVGVGSKGTTLSVATSSVGHGGHGAVFLPLFSPHDANTLLASCDMGGFYVSHDCGDTWRIHSVGGRVYALEADPSTRGTFYAAGPGLWRSTDNGDTWSLVWPNPASVTATPSDLNKNRTYYFTSDSYPNGQIVEALAVDPRDPKHLVALTAVGEGTNADSSRYVFESLDGGATFACLADYRYTKALYNGSFLNNHVFIEHGPSSAASRVVISNPQGVYEVNRAAASATSALTPLHEPAGAHVVVDVAQVTDADGVHYVVMETQDDVAGTAMSLWHTTDFSDPVKKVDLTAEFNQLPREYGPQDDRGKSEPATRYRLNRHAAVLLVAPSLSRMYLAYHVTDYTDAKSYWSGINGLVEYDATRAAGAKFFWVHGERLYWNGADAAMRITPHQNQLMARAHADASFLFFGIAADPNDAKRILLGTHTSVVYSPNIDAQVGQIDGVDKVNLYPKYATIVERDASNLVESRMRSNGIEVTVTQHVRTDPFDPSHLLLSMDDAGVTESHDDGATWRWFYTKRPKTEDTCWDTVFDEGERGVVYSGWDAKGNGTYTPSDGFLTSAGSFVVSRDGGTTWGEPATGLPATASPVAIAVGYPRDAGGKVTNGARTVYVATMGYGFYVSRDSGASFEPMNAGVTGKSHTWSGNTAEVIWARDVLLTDDGRLFGMTSYSTLDTSTSYRTQDEATFGNVYEWDFDRQTWVKLPFNKAGDDISGVNARQPRAFAYDSATRTLYVAAVSVIGSWNSDKSWNNFGGGLYTYTSAAGAAVGSGSVAAVDATSAAIGGARNLTGVALDVRGNLWVATEDGDVFLKSAEFDWVQVYAKLMRRCKGLDLGADGTLYLNTTGIGALRIRPTFTAAGGSESGSPTGAEAGSPGASDADPSADGGTGTSGDAGAEGGQEPSDGGQAAVTPATADTPTTPDVPTTAATPEAAATPTTADVPVTADVPATAASPQTPTEPDEPTGWAWDGAAWRYRLADGSHATGWVWDGAAWYLLADEAGRAGVMQRDRWVWDAGDWFHLGKSGAMEVGWVLDAAGWYFLNPDPNLRLYGAMVRSSWVLDRGSWYYAGPDGVILTGWQWVDRAWYCLAPDGRLYVDTITPDGSYVDGTGRWRW